jgi:hypothetical protein
VAASGRRRRRPARAAPDEIAGAPARGQRCRCGRGSRSACNSRASSG